MRCRNTRDMTLPNSVSKFFLDLIPSTLWKRIPGKNDQQQAKTPNDTEASFSTLAEKKSKGSW